MAQPQHLDALGEMARDLVHARREIDRLQDLLLLLRLDVHVGGREVGERAGRGGRLQRRDQLRRRLRQQLDRLDRLPLQVQEARLDLRRTCSSAPGCEARAPRGTGVPGKKSRMRKRCTPWQTMWWLPSGAGDVAHDIGDRADAVEIVGAGIVGLGIALQQDADRPLLAHRLLRGGDRFRPADGDRDDDAREQHDVAHRHDDQGVGRDLQPMVSGARRSGLDPGCLIVRWHGHLLTLDFASRKTMQPFVAKRLTA